MNFERMFTQKVLTSQLVGMVNMNEVYGDVDMIDENMVVVLATHAVNNKKQSYEKPEEKDVGDDIDADSDADTEYDEDEGVEMNTIDKDHGDVDVIDSDVIVIGNDFDFEYNEDVVETVEMQVHKKTEKRDGARRPCSQSSQPRMSS
jgi:hypothetical protein